MCVAFRETPRPKTFLVRLWRRYKMCLSRRSPASTTATRRSKHMQFFTLLVSALSLVAAVTSLPTEFEERAAPPTVQVTYDTVYDVKTNSLDIVACSNGANGLEHLGYKTFGQLPNFPFIGGAQAVTGWNSPKCGSCWQLTYKGRTVNILAVDYAQSGFNIGLKAMNKLTNGQAEELGNVQVVAKEVAPSVCGM
ncbi:Cerato-platanin-domain-containing protein [Lentinus tigrinus ALCF2SS1-7]|uniref:Cerato-platanin-domain-containing protein n=1 Tax=Lentinus tigrinus ALCF2SS1-6 TaxID=1328759 RepID=A0A5C2SBD4_9APHY|nr:Cerato-platanin-domain-containing protein [Lentinus tigrinus ALCF2SS1-6]RPD75143.1 Cerato-platanin-domain-containing protein [Lentinus tigrinus ALCF2SS1-7]